MAGNNKDVELVIRAKNAASKELDAVSTSLGKVSKAQDDAGRSAKSFDALLGTLGNEFKKLNAEVAGLTSLGKIAEQVGKAEGAVQRLESTTRSSAQTFAQQARDLQAAEQAANRLRAEVDMLAGAYKTQKDALSAARAEQRGANAELSSAEKALARVQVQAAKTTSPSPWSNAADSAATFMQAEVAKAQQSAQAAAATTATLETELKNLAARRNEVTAATKTATAQERQLQTAVEKSADAVRNNNAALTEARGGLSEIQSVATQAAVSLGGISVNQEKIAAATAEATAELAREKATLDAISKYSTGASRPTFTDPAAAAAQKAVRAEMEAALQTQKTLEAEAARLAQAMRGVTAPTQQQVTAFQSVTGAAGAAKVQFQQLQAQLAALQGSTQGSIQKLNEIDGGLKKIKLKPVEIPPPPANSWSQFFESFNSSSRESMSLFQRLRGELLGLTAAYVGFYAAIEQVKGVIDTYKQLEAAQNRLGAVFGQNKEAVGTELQWVQRQADRLALSFGTLANEYSKFAIAANAANMSSEGTKKIFLSVAEAGRVNKLSTQQMSDVFLAFTQMINKGKIQGQELTQQLGERLPGATVTFAKALGLTTAELAKLMEAGEVMSSENALLKVATQLNKMYGGQLAESLKTTTSLIEQFWNAMQQGQLIIANSGFIEAFNRLLGEMNNYFRSDEGRTFFLKLGSAMTTVVNIVEVLFKNMGLISDALMVLVSIKAAQWVLALATSLVASLLPALVTTTAGVTTLNVGLGTALAQSMSRMIVLIGEGIGTLVTLTAGMVTAAGAARGLGAAVSLVGAALNRIPAIALLSVVAYAVTSVLGSWATGVDGATAALTAHEATMKKVLTAYDEVKGKTKNWADALSQSDKANLLTKTQEDFRTLKGQFDELVGELGANSLLNGKVVAFKFWQEGAVDAAAAINKLKGELQSGQINITQFREGLQGIYNKTTSDAAREFLEGLIKQSREAENLKEGYQQSAVAAKDLGSVWTAITDVAASASTSIDKLSGSMNSSATAADAAAAAAERYKQTLLSLKGLIPAFAAELKQLEAQTKLDQIKRQISDMGPSGQTPEMQGLLRRAQNNVNTIGIESRLSNAAPADAANNREFVQAASKAAEQLGVAGKDFMAVLYERSGGLITPEGLKGAVKGVTGLDEKSTITDVVGEIAKQMKNAGITPGANKYNVYSAAATGDANKVKDSATNSTSEAAGIINSVDQMEYANAAAEAYEKVYSSLAKVGEEQGKQQNRTDTRIQQLQDETAGLEAGSEGLKKQLVLNKAIAQAKKENPNITQAEIDKIVELTGKEYDLRQSTKKTTESHKELNMVMRSISDLESARNDLLRIRKHYEETGQLDKMKETDARLQGINQQLTENIDRAIKMWQAIGGTEAEAAIAKLQATQTEIQAIGAKSKWSGQQINESLANGLTNAVDTFFNALDEGETIIGALAKAFRKFASDFLIEIGKMILKQALLNALQAGGGASGGVGGFIASAIGALFHTGGVVGESGPSRAVSPGWFSNAVKYHDGGVAGLQPGEVPAILKKGEVVDPGDGSVFGKVFGRQEPANVKIINAIDSGSFVSEGLNTDVGSSALLNYMRANSSTLRSVLGIG